MDKKNSGGALFMRSSSEKFVYHKPFVELNAIRMHFEDEFGLGRGDLQLSSYSYFRREHAISPGDVFGFRPTPPADFYHADQQEFAEFSRSMAENGLDAVSFLSDRGDQEPRKTFTLILPAVGSVVCQARYDVLALLSMLADDPETSMYYDDLYMAFQRLNLGYGNQAESWVRASFRDIRTQYVAVWAGEPVTMDTDAGNIAWAFFELQILRMILEINPNAFAHRIRVEDRF
jgi:hypothetical protein